MRSMRKAASASSHEDIEAIVGDAAETALDNFAYAVERRRCQGGAVRAPAACGRAGTDRSVGAVGARTAFHATASRRRGARLGRQPGAGREVAQAAAAFQARAGVHRALQALGRGQAFACAAADPGGGQALAALSPISKAPWPNGSCSRSPRGFDGTRARCMHVGCNTRSGIEPAQPRSPRAAEAVRDPEGEGVPARAHHARLGARERFLFRHEAGDARPRRCGLDGRANSSRNSIC